MNATVISSAEVVEVLRAAIRGEMAVSLSDPDRPWSAWSDVSFSVGRYRVVFFNDCGDLDYVSECSDGERRGEFDDWTKDLQRNNPLDFLTREEEGRLECLLEAAK